MIGTKSANSSAANHELLITLSGKVDTLASSLDRFVSHTAGEFDKLWKHVDARDERLTNAIASIGDRVANFGKPNIQAIVSVCVFLGGLALAFIAPIKADIAREHEAINERARLMMVLEDKVVRLQSAETELREKQKTNVQRIEDIATNGSGITRERLAVIENELKWMREDKTNKMQ